jgi:hypothetical protein
MDNVKRAIGLAALAAALAPAGLAQERGQVATPQPEQPAEESVRTFEAAYFRQYNPVTAADIVNRVPGFEIDDGETLRGFGATAGNVLVNGERPSSKVLISEQLKRIPADSVVKVELISGSSSSLDVRGQTQLVNVILKQAKQGSSPTTWVADLRDIQYSERLGWQFQLTRTFALGDNAEVTLDLQTPNLRGRVESFEAVRNAAGVLTGYREGFGQPNYIGVQGSGVLKWRPTARDTVSLNAQVAPTWNTQNIASVLHTAAGAFAQGTFGESDYSNNYTVEIGADWEHRFSPELSAKMIGLVTQANVDQDDIFQIFTPTGPGPGGLANVQTLNRTTEAGERVARGFLTWRPNGVHTIDIGVEGAFNYRDTTLDIFNNNGSGPAPQLLPVSDARVEEERIEPFITDVWKISPQLTLETGFIFEASRITQTGDEEKEREFSYPKPRAILTWQAGPDRPAARQHHTRHRAARLCAVRLIHQRGRRLLHNRQPGPRTREDLEGPHRVGETLWAPRRADARPVPRRSRGRAGPGGDRNQRRLRQSRRRHARRGRNPWRRAAVTAGSQRRDPVLRHVAGNRGDGRRHRREAPVLQRERVELQSLLPPGAARAECGLGRQRGARLRPLGVQARRGHLV